MSSGLPDYFRLVRPVHGGAAQEVEQKTAVASGITYLSAAKGKGIIYGGTLICQGVATQKTSIPRMFIDDGSLSAATFFALNYWSMNSEKASLFYALGYDDTNFVYSVGIMPGITFDKELKIAFSEVEGNTPMVTSYLMYALM